MSRAEFNAAIPVRHGTENRGVVARISSDGTELWLGLPIFFTAYHPPTSPATVSFRYNTSVSVVRWDDGAFRRWKWQFLQSVGDFFDRRFQFRPAGYETRQCRSAVGNAANAGPPTVTARFFPYEVTQRVHARMAPLCFKLPEAQPGQAPSFIRSSCIYFGGVNYAVSQLPQGADASVGFTALLDSGDLAESSRTHTVDGDTVTSTQAAAHHEVGHHLGLVHRCANATGSAAENGPALVTSQRRFVHRGARTDRKADDDYCDGATRASAVTDLMASGNQVHPWHASLWLEILPHVTANGHQYSHCTWEPHVLRQSPSP